MLIGILSDTHDQVERTRNAVGRLKDAGAEAIIHCGDLTTGAVVRTIAGIPSYFVFGNCDYDHGVLGAAIAEVGGTCLDGGGLIELGERRIAVTHGHLDEEIDRLASLQPNYFLSGHTHRQSDVRKGATRWINPGALHRANPWTVALLDLASDHLTVLTISNTKMRD